MVRKTFVALVFSVSSLSLITGCGGAPSASLTVYSGQHPQLMAKLVSAFEAKTSRSVALRSASEQVLVSQVVTEASHSPADVVVTENAPAMNALAEHHLAMRLPTRQLAQLAVEARGPGRAWAGVSRRVNVLVYDAERVKANELPRRIEDLAQARFKDLLGLAPGGVFPATIVANRAVRSYRTISPLPLLAHYDKSNGQQRRYIFCGTFRRLSPPRRYLAPYPMEPGLSSLCINKERLPNRLSRNYSRLGF